MRAFVLTALIAASAGPAEAAPLAPGRARVLVIDFKPIDVPAATASTVTGLVAAGLGTYPTLDVVSGEDVRNLIALEASRSAAGCDDASCLAEISDALGAQLVVSGTVARLGAATVVSINLFDASKAQALGRVTTQTTRDDRLPGRIARRLHELVGPYHEQNNLVLRPPPEPEPGPDPTPWVVAGVGAGIVGLGAVGAIVGALPALSYGDAVARVQAAETRLDSDAASAIADARQAQKDLANARDAYNSWGFLVLDAGLGIGLTGVVVGIVGAVWGLNSGEPPDPDTPAASTTTPTGGAR
jgi:hypothetical protein